MDGEPARVPRLGRMAAAASPAAASASGRASFPPESAGPAPAPCGGVARADPGAADVLARRAAGSLSAALDPAGASP